MKQLKSLLGLGLAKLRVLGYFQGVPECFGVPGCSGVPGYSDVPDFITCPASLVTVIGKLRFP